jgi:hypothetical protein
MYAVAIKIHCFLKGVNALFGAPLGKWHSIKALREKPKVMELYNIVQFCISMFTNLNVDGKITSSTLNVQLIKIFEMKNHREV